jgi:hypothetical protein
VTGWRDQGAATASIAARAGSRHLLPAAHVDAAVQRRDAIAQPQRVSERRTHHIDRLLAAVVAHIRPRPRLQQYASGVQAADRRCDTQRSDPPRRHDANPALPSTTVSPSDIAPPPSSTAPCPAAAFTHWDVRSRPDLHTSPAIACQCAQQILNAAVISRVAPPALLSVHQDRPVRFPPHSTSRRISPSRPSALSRHNGDPCAGAQQWSVTASHGT